MSTDNKIVSQYIRGLPFPAILNFQRDVIECALEYKPKDGDVLVASYPKSGSNWVQQIVWQILNKGSGLAPMTDAESPMPTLDRIGREAVDSLPPPRVYKTHFPYHFLNINTEAKYIYIQRNPKDVVASYYHYAKHLHGLYGVEFDFDYFFQLCMNSKIWYGDHMDHVLSFYGHRNDDHVLFLSYETMIENRRESLLRIAKFLGNGYHEMLSVDESLLQRILTLTGLDYMKKNLVFKRRLYLGTKENEEQETTINIVRKGVIGDGKALFNQEQSEILLAKTLEKMDGTELKDSWISYY